MHKPAVAAASPGASEPAFLAPPWSAARSLPTTATTPTAIAAAAGFASSTLMAITSASSAPAITTDDRLNWSLRWTRCRDANRYTPRIKSGAGPRMKSGAGPGSSPRAGHRIKSEGRLSLENALIVDLRPARAPHPPRAAPDPPGCPPGRVILFPDHFISPGEGFSSVDMGKGGTLYDPQGSHHPGKEKTARPRWPASVPERAGWGVIGVGGSMMGAETIGGLVFGSIALVADGLHMSTHAGALLLAALAYTYARKHANNPAFTFGTGKLGDLAGFTSAIVLAMIALLIGYESVSRIFDPVPIPFAQAIPIACLGLAVNLASAWLLSSGEHHGHSQGHGHANEGHDHDETHEIATAGGLVVLEVFEGGVPPRFRLRAITGAPLTAQAASIETPRSDGTRQRFPLGDNACLLESHADIPQPHASPP